VAIGTFYFGPTWGSIPVASSNGNGTFTVTNASVPNFPTWAGLTGVQMLTIPVASPNGDGTFTVTNNNVLNFPTWASTPGVKIVTGDFSGGGLSSDIALVGGPGWASIPVAHSHPGGTFTLTNDNVPAFPAMAATPGVKALAVSQAVPHSPPPK
jgi:hypothetical protein